MLFAVISSAMFMAWQATRRWTTQVEPSVLQHHRLEQHATLPELDGPRRSDIIAAGKTLEVARDTPDWQSMGVVPSVTAGGEARLTIRSSFQTCKAVAEALTTKVGL